MECMENLLTSGGDNFLYKHASFLQAVDREASKAAFRRVIAWGRACRCLAGHHRDWS